tara:strand:+ start:865 stop:1128 length:264 start_codon:yes stop_codon:yes gene_type:complete
MPDEVITEEEIAQHFSAMDDSVNLINTIVADDTEARSRATMEEIRLSIKRNTDHLEIQAAKSWYSASGRDKGAYISSVAAGKVYVKP